MKRIIRLYIIIIFSMIVCSCFGKENLKVLDLENVVWKNKDFNINVSSEILKKQNDLTVIPSADDYYTTITVRDEIYSCIIKFETEFDQKDLYYYSYFKIYLTDEKNNSIIHYKNQDGDYFIYCGYYITEMDDCVDYKYVMDGNLSLLGQYYDYCKNNNLFYPLSITFYGYENK